MSYICSLISVIGNACPITNLTGRTTLAALFFFGFFCLKGMIYLEQELYALYCVIGVHILCILFQKTCWERPTYSETYIWLRNALAHVKVTSAYRLVQCLLPLLFPTLFYTPCQLVFSFQCLIADPPPPPSPLSLLSSLCLYLTTLHGFFQLSTFPVHKISSNQTKSQLAKAEEGAWNWSTYWNEQ